MADKMSGTAKAVKPNELKKVISSISADKAKASEYNGAAGQTTKDFMKKHGCDRKAFNLVLGLTKQEVVHQQATLRGIIELAHKAGMFDEVDAFDDIVTRMRTIADEVEARRHNQDRGDPEADQIFDDE